MTMSRRDTIILAALVNACLLSVLFFTAMRPDANDTQAPYAEQIAMVTEPTPVVVDLQPVNAAPTLPTDEVDAALKPYLTQAPLTTQLDNTPSFEVPVQNQPTPVAQQSEMAQEPAKQVPVVATAKTTEVTVKRGDSLDKIARANGTTINELKRVNNLNSDRLDIGQVLKVPAKKEGPTSATTTAAKAPKPVAEQPPAGTVYHTIKPGDNPWKIAKQYSVKFDDLLKLNGLNEEKARNLKVGQKIRVR